jgi:hypothetical protein
VHARVWDLCLKTLVEIPLYGGFVLALLELRLKLGPVPVSVGFALHAL